MVFCTKTQVKVGDLVEIILLAILAVIGLVVGYNLSKVVDEAILWKEKQKDKKYNLYRTEYYWDKWINGILIAISFAASFYYFGVYKAVFTSVITLLAVFGARLDERIRIIPNELVLFILILGLVSQILRTGIKGLASGFLAVIVTGSIFFLSAFLTRFLSGSIGVGAGDIKLAMALSMIMGIDNMFIFLTGIVLFLLFYIIVGFLTKTLTVGSAFPMCTQIMGGAMLALYYPVILELIETLSR